jgi:DNA-binding GntR family transcriptional regulator
MPSMLGKDTISDTVTSRLRDMIVSGVLAAGSKINETSLSERLDVSRTPLREALRSLETEGLITSEHNKGFRVAPLDAQEIRELYPIIYTLEGLAVQEGGVFLNSALPRLRAINSAFKKNKCQRRDAARIDAEFHDELTRHTSNRRLLEMIKKLKLRISRYENIYMSNPALIEISHTQHARIVDHLAAGKLNEALRALEANWRFGMDALIRTLQG